MSQKDINELVKILDDHMDKLEKNKSTPYIIKWKGKRLITVSGKSSWSTKGAAKNAFHHHAEVISYRYKRNNGTAYSNNVYHDAYTGLEIDLLDMFIQQGLLEFVNMVEPEKKQVTKQKTDTLE